MKKSIFLIIALFLISNVFGQDKNTLKTQLQDVNLLPQEKPLLWIKTSRDFPQENLSVEQIDAKIDSIILTQKNKMVEDIETPINFKKLKYYGYQDFKTLKIVKDDEFFTKYPNEYEDADGKKQIFQYDKITILCTFNANEDQLNVYAIIRAFLILKNKYPDLYQNLFINTESSPLLNDNLIKDNIPVTILNINNSYVFTIHENNAKASNATTTCYNEPPYKQPFIDKSIYNDNVHLLFLNKNTLRNGGASNGAVAIYKDIDNKTAQIKYLFDGLIQTIVHERLHNYIGNAMTVNNYLNYIRNNNSLIKGKPNKDGTFFISTYYFMEEPIVTNTTNELFKKYGGISMDVMNYYSNLFITTQLGDMKLYTKYDELLLKLKGLNPKILGTDYSKILQIYF